METEFKNMYKLYAKKQGRGLVLTLLILLQ